MTDPLNDFMETPGVTRAPANPPGQFKVQSGDVWKATFVAETDDTQGELDRWASTLLGLSAGTMRLLEVVDVRAWGHNPETGVPYRYVRALAKREGADDMAYREAMQRQLARRPRRAKKAPAPRKSGVPSDVYFPVQDTQFGRHRDRLGDIETTKERATWMAEEGLPAYVADCRKAGLRVDRIVLPLGGDLTEGCDSKGDNRLFMIKKNLIDQYEYAVDVVERLVIAATDLAPEVILTGCSSNHDANARRLTATNVTDGWDDRTFQLLRQVGRLHDRAAYGGLRVLMPPHPDVWLVEGPLTVAGIHGHMPKTPGATPALKLWNWWKQEIANRRIPAAAQVMVTAHFHHGFQLGPQSGRWLIGQPSWDNGSDYFEDGGGDWSLPGTAAFCATADGVRRTETVVWPQDRATVREQVGTLVA